MTESVMRMSNRLQAPLSKTQMGIYVECMAHPEFTTYNLPMLMRLGESIDTESLKAAVYKTITAHPSLETVLFAAEDGSTMQRISHGTVQVDEYRMSEEAFAKARERLVRPFDLSGGLLARFEIYHTPSAAYLFMDIHHVIIDGTSLFILARDLWKAYEGQELQEETYTGLDVAAEENQALGSEEYQRAKAFYGRLLDGVETDCLPLRDCFLEEPVQGHVVYRFCLDEKRLKEFRKKNGISTTSFFTAAAGFLIAKYNYRDESLISTVYSARGTAQRQQVVSMLVRTLPFVMDLRGNPTIPQLLKRENDVLMEERRQELYSFEEMATDYGIKADINFAFQGKLLDYQGMGRADVQVERLEDAGQVEQTALLMEVGDIGGGVYELHLGYRADMFSSFFAKNLARAYGKVCAEFLEKQRVDDVELTDEKSLSILEGFHAPDHPYDTRSTVVDLIRAQAANHPDQTAVVYLDRRYSYQEVNELSDRLAGELLRKGLQKEDVVGILIPKNEYIVIASLGVLKAGGAYMPMDASYPSDRLNFMLKDAEAKILLTTRELMGRITQDFAGEKMLVETIPDLPAVNGELQLPKIDASDLFILLYTSGSTGLPKGVMMVHRNLMSLCAWARRYYALDSTARGSAYASYGFDASMFETWPLLTAGGALYIIDESIRLDLMRVQDYFNENNITHSFMTTQVGRQFALLEGTATLRHLSVGGEKLVPLAPPSYHLHNVYGPTECTVLVTVQEVTERQKDVPIGSAIDDVRLYVVDKNGRRLPPGAAGELLIAGYHVARSYLNRPEQTVASFTTNPFCAEKGYERIYHTGDVVRFLEDGSVQFIGRRDAQVKVRGFRIELTEVEEIIRRFPGIKDVTVAAYDDPAGGKYLAAYVVSDAPVSVEALDAFILAEKPPYMVPAVTMQIDRIPMNQNQKVDRRKLPTPERKFEDVRQPENENQKRIYAIVSEVIGNSGFGVNTDLYQAGLTSVGSVRLNVLLAKAFGRNVQIRDLKENNTIEKLERFLLSGPADQEGDNGKGKAEDKEIRTDYPLAKSQEGIFVETMAHPDSVVYNIPVLLELSDEVDLHRLATATADAVGAHPYIKTRLFMDEAGQIRQRRIDADPFLPEDVEVLQCEHFYPGDSQLAEPFSLLGGRLFRVAIIQSDRNYLFVDMHHIISDGTSMGLFLNDISKAYQGATLEREEYSGFDAALFEEEQRKGPLGGSSTGFEEGSVLEKARDYYKKLLSGADPESLPEGDVRKGGEQSSQEELFGRYALAGDVRRFCEVKRLSENGFFTAVFGLVLSKYTGKEDAVFATIYNGRSDSRLAESVAMLVKTLPVRISISKDTGDVSTEAFVSDVSGQLLESMTNDIYSFGEMSREYGIRSDVMFAYQGENFNFDEICGYPAKLIQTGSDQAKAPLNLVIDLQQGRIHYFLEYNGARFSSAFARGFLDAMDIAVSEFLTKERIGDVSILSPEAKRELRRFNDTAGPVSPLTVPEMLEQQAMLHSEKIAVTAGEEVLTYSELNRRSNRVAHALLEAGIQAQDRVAFCMRRTVDAYAVREGILKAGGAFLALDPEYPDERISYILNDAGARFLVIPEELYSRRGALFERFLGKVLLLEALQLTGRADTQVDANPQVRIDPSGLAYCIYTSGSTGKPKGVMVEHRNLMNMLSLHEKNVLAKDYVENTTVFLGLAAFTFDVSVIEELMPLCHGQTVAMATEEEIHNPALLADMMLRRGVDMMKCTPSYMFTMLDFKESSRVLPGLAAIIIGAEPFPAGLYEKMRAAGFTGKLFNSYGPTETTVTVTIDELDGRQVTIGRPAGNTGVYMLDAFGNILPKLARGELVITGKSVGRGYVGLAKQTAENFIILEGERAYRSGDIAWWNTEGKIVHCGRSDNQVKLRGLRVELDEIVNAMNLFPGIQQSVVLVKGEGAAQFLCGYYVSDSPVDKEKLREFLGRTLAEYMLPAVFVHLSSMPMTPNGKVDRRSLPEPAPEVQKRSGRESKTDLEKTFCEMFASILGIDHVYADDDFFELGGTSLSASKVAVKCMVEKINVAYADVFRFGTPEKLAAYVEGQAGLSGVKVTGGLSAQDISAHEKPSQNTAEVDDAGGEPLSEVLHCNDSAFVDDISQEPLGNVLVTGATGFLGIHAIRELLENGRASGTRRIYCLVRRGKSQSVTQRMKMMLMFYFENPYEEEVGSRIIPVEGDITEESLAEKLSDCDFDTVINCAASVKHFAADDLLERVNVQGVRNLIRVCRQRGKKLIQISTVSVAGESVDNHIPESVRLRENRLDLGQALDNVYAKSKYEAEELVLQGVSEGLRGKVIRVGNLMSRSADGEFQINYSTNAFMNRLKAYSILEQFPVDAMDQEVEFSPIDSTARAIMLLAGTPDKFTVFHAYNCHTVHMANVIDAMREYGMPVEVVSHKEFQRHFHEVLSDDTQNEGIASLVTYLNSGKENRRYVGWENNFTVKALYRLGFSWPLTGEEYIRRSLEALSTLGFFGIE